MLVIFLAVQRTELSRGRLVSRPDLAFVTSQLRQYSANPRKARWTVLMRVFRYLKGTRNLSATFQTRTLMY